MNSHFLACLLVATAVAPARAGDWYDSPMLRDPELPVAKEMPVFSESLAVLWLQALDRPEADYRCQAALAVAEAHRQGMKGLARAMPQLIRELDKPDQHPTVRLAAAKALVALDAKDAAANLFAASNADPDLRELVEPALARWAFGPAREAWLQRIAAPPPHRRATVLAMHGLAALREEKTVARLREIALAADTVPFVRLEAARALGVIRRSGSEPDADALAADTSPRGNLSRLAAVSLLRHHDGAEATRRLQTFAVDPDPSVVAVALTRLIEIDPKHVVPVLPQVLANADANARSLGVDVLFRQPSDAHIVRLGERLSDAHPDVRAKARRHLRELAAKAEFKEWVIRDGTKALAGRDWRGKEQSAVLLAQLDHKPASTRLVELMSDPRPEVAVASGWALRVLAVPETLPKVFEYVETYTRRVDQEVERKIPFDDLDRQLCQLIQFLGYARHREADAVFRRLVPPQPVTMPHTRAAAVWALGLFHEGLSVPPLAAAVARRLAAVTPFDVEDDRVRRMCAVTLGRIKANAEVPTIRRFYTGKPTTHLVNNACGWALEQILGEKMPAPEPVEIPRRAWFLFSTED